MKLLGAFLVRNEGAPDRYLRRSLQNAKQWCDTVLVLDDRSEDDTAAVCREEGAYVVTRESDTPAWGNESPARAELWDLAVAATKDYGGWILFADADMTLSADPRPLLATEYLNAWCWPLRDLWDSETTYRVDPPWQGHKTPRVWLVNPSRVPDDWLPKWPARGLHCGHIPENFPIQTAVAPPQYYWNHYSYLSPEHRAQKQAQYLSRRELLNSFELAHALTISDAA